MSFTRNKFLIFALLLAIWEPPAMAQLLNLPAEVRAAIAEIGPKFTPAISQKITALMQPLQESRTDLVVDMDAAYGSDPLEKLDLYASQKHATGPIPMVVFVHGGGFTAGDKRDGANVAAYFARHGLLGISINYRLAPAATWPAQSVDIGSAVGWLKKNATRYGGDPSRIVVIGHSSGGSVVASYVFDQAINTTRDGVVGAVLVSGGYGYASAPAATAHLYYGEDPLKVDERTPHTHLLESKLPLLIVTTEYDIPAIAAENHALASALCLRDGQCPPFAFLSGHNHISEIQSIDTQDQRLGQKILEFVGVVTNYPQPR